MANPAPTINQINAFNATQGTTIDFNIIGGTELVRSNRIYIYDLSDNSLICTHLYTSTESMHELPANTDSSIVYESGKSSADFVNGAQYYAQIQTYTDTAGTQGGSGLSVAKMFWCLVSPTLTITTIPSTISTTSYNVSATYTDTSANVVSNIIQQYQFNLYSATGSLLQSSGVVVGSGVRQGTSATYGISYNFTGLSVGSSYYVVVNVTTTQGMNVSAQSGTFTVSIDTPTLGEATVVNNACDGYISVTSNLSSEYGGSASGEIASFVTNSVNNVSSLKVFLDPIQDLNGYDAPWVGGAGKNKLDTSTMSTATTSGVTFSRASDGTITVGGKATATVYREIGSIQTESGVQYTITGTPSGGASVKYRMTVLGYGYDYGNGYTFTGDGNSHKISIDVYTGYPQSGTLIFKPMVRLASETDATYAPYENICPISGHTEVVTQRTGSNLFDKSTATADSTWTTSGTQGYLANKTSSALIPVQPSTDYYVGFNGTANVYGVYEFDADKNYVGRTFAGAISPKAITTRADCYYVGLVMASSYVDTAFFSYPSTVTDYEPYQGQTYTATLPETVYGGTVDLVSGEVVIDRAMVDLGSLTWNLESASSGRFRSRVVDYTSQYDWDGDWTITKSNCFVCEDPGLAYSNRSYYSFTNIKRNYYNFDIKMPVGVFEDANTFKTWLSNIGAYVCIELATPRTIQLTPQEIQTLLGTNNVWSEDGEVKITYNIPITNLLVKRQDVADVSGTWLTLYSQPITQASDMDFTFIDFLNQYGKTYKYALVPLLTQTQSGVEVEVEGGYTVSDEVQSIFDGVFIADQTGLQKCKANVGYGDVDMNQAVGTITPIGSKYPVVITNSKNQYHNGSITGTIVPDDYYFNGNLSRIDMVNKRNELEQFLTNKRAKIIKDWNSNIWLVMITDNIGCNFNNNYGMGMVNFNANWIEVGDPTNQQDLQATGLINVGGV